MITTRAAERPLVLTDHHRVEPSAGRGYSNWLVMGVGMSGGMMGQPGRPSGVMFGAGALGLLILAGVIAAMIWALRSPFGDKASSGPGRRGGDRPEKGPLINS